MFSGEFSTLVKLRIISLGKMDRNLALQAVDKESNVVRMRRSPILIQKCEKGL